MRLRAAVCTLSALAAGPLPAQPGSRLWRPDERVAVADLSWIQALAASDELLYVAAAGGLATYDRRFERWAPPLSALDGYPTERIVAALIDPLDRSLWLGTERGVVHYSPALRQFETVTVPGGVAALMFDADEAHLGLFVRGSRGWQFLDRGGVAFDRPLPPPPRQRRSVTVAQVLERFPFLEARAALDLTDERLRSFRYTAAALAPRGDVAFLGTNGLGVIAVEGALADTRRLTLGLLGRAAGAVVVARGGVWVGTGPDAARVGFTFVAADLQRYAHEEGTGTAGFDFAVVRDLVVVNGALWAATDLGVHVVEPGRGARSVFTGFGAGMEHAYALAAADRGVWVGTGRGLAHVTDGDGARKVDQRVHDRIYALAARGDSVWVGGARGLGKTWRGASEIVVPPEAAEEPLLSGVPIVALALVGDTLVAATPERIVWRAPDSAWVAERVLPELGALAALAVDREGLWIGGARGVAFYRFRSRDFTVFNRPGDLPGPVRDLVADGRYLWVATEEGLVRFAREALVP